MQVARFEFSKLPLLLILLPLVIGYAVGEFFFLPYAHLATYFGLSALFLFALCVWRLRSFSPRQYMPLSLQIGFVATVFCAAVAHYLQHYRGQQVDWGREKITARAVVSQVVHEGESGTTYHLRLRTAPYADHKVQAFIGGKHKKLNIGDEILFRTYVRPLRAVQNPSEIDYSALLLRQDIKGRLYLSAHDWKVVKTCTADPTSLRLLLCNKDLQYTEALLLYRQQLVEQYVPYFTTHERSVIVAMSLGDKSGLNANIRELYSRTGASHVLALSGLHLAIFYTLFEILFRRFLSAQLGVWAVMTSLLLIVLLWAYTFLAAAPLSLLRACTMFSLGRCFLLLSRRPNPLHACLLSLLLLLLVTPFSLFDLGFQLSYLAVLGILLFLPLFPMPVAWGEKLRPMLSIREKAAKRRWHEIRYQLVKFLWSMCVVSLAAQIATAPLLAYVFHRLPLLALFSNFVVLPMAYALLLGGLLFLFVPACRVVVSGIMSAALQYGEMGLHFLSRFPFATIEVWISLPMMWLCYGILGALYCYWRNTPRHNWHKKIPFSFCLLGTTVIAFIIDQSQLRRLPVGTWLYYHSSNLLVHHISPDGTSWLLCSDTLKARQQLHNTANNYWQAKALHPRFLPVQSLSSVDEKLFSLPTDRKKKNFASSASAFTFWGTHRVVSFMGQRWAYVCETLPKHLPRTPLNVDFLVLGKGCRRSLSHILAFYQPKQLFLAANLSDFYRLRYTQEAQAAHISVVDLANEGAMFIPAICSEK